MQAMTIYPQQLRSDYLRAEASQGTLLDPLQKRHVAFPSELILGFHQTLLEETGQAWDIIAQTCGRSWGEHLLVHWQQEWEQFYQMDMRQADYQVFLQWMQIYFSFQGWGKPKLRYEHQSQGLLMVELHDSALVELLAPLETRRSCSLFAGLLGAIFGQLTEEPLDAIELRCRHEHPESPCLFAIALQERIETLQIQRMRGQEPGLDDLLNT